MASAFAAGRFAHVIHFSRLEDGPRNTLANLESIFTRCYHLLGCGYIEVLLLVTTTLSGRTTSLLKSFSSLLCTPTMQALYQEILPPSGVEFGTTLRLTPSTLPPSNATQPFNGALYNLVVARANILRVFEVKDDPAPISSQLEDERQRRAEVRRDTEAVEGEVEMDRQGEGFVNMGSVKVISDTLLSMSTTSPITDICHHSIFELPERFGTIELIVPHRPFSLQVPEAPVNHRPSPASILFVNTVFTAQSPDWRVSASCHHTKTDSIVCLCHSRTRKSVDVAFPDSFIAKSTDITQIALLEWSAAVHDLITVSIHTYERAPQLVSIR